ncbi:MULTISPECIES: histidine phosphatase family protein [unclassified Halomonas]|uniref:histidine phosphatase family protein n=1 Tax=unclassified Halomonas TaxID=2609666 RepID=UPI0007DA3DBF|nr:MULTISPECIES: histidine phosphatase family protein [unclassified Halomonas]MBT2787595.1 histidine phosphatase family protein [Halomonas sp. ISL-106]MBT2799022.1 histidine phosphatase family protein [Halomonas sp. ISL-104]OAL61544.1 histidine phosphatase family protein [Halomonas sp. ALS9]
MPTLRHLTLTLLLGALVMLPITAQANEATWQALKEGGLVILMRHSLAPGIGDPPGFELSQCETQRNLSAQGRAQAQATGRVLRERAIPIAAVYSSSWCRAMDTAELMDVGEVAPAPWLDSFFRGRGDQTQITQTAQEQIAAWQGSGNLLLITHQVNITALVGSGVGSGEMIVVRPTVDPFQVVGRLNVSGN